MNWKNMYIALILCCLISCKEQAFELTLSDDQLMHALADIHILEIVINKKDNISKDSIKSAYTGGMEEVYGMPFSEIEQNIVELRKRPKKYNEIYILVTKQLEAEMDSIKNQDLRGNNELLEADLPK